MNGSNKILRDALEKTWVKGVEIGAILTGLGVFYFLAKWLAKDIPEQYFLEIIVILLAVVLFLLTFTIIFYFKYEIKELYHKPKGKPVKENLKCVDVEYAIDELIKDIENKGFKPDIIMGIDRGGAIVGGMLAKHLERPLTTISSSDNWTISDTTSSLDDGVKHKRKRTDKYLKIEKILLVDDACRRGDTLKNAYDILNEKEKFNFNLKMATILNEERIRHKDFSVDFFVYETKRTDILMPWDKKR